MRWQEAGGGRKREEELKGASRRFKKLRGGGGVGMREDRGGPKVLRFQGSKVHSWGPSCFVLLT